MFDIKIFRSTHFDFPVINVGNITVGGTGKTPHVEYLIDLLRSKYKVAVLSRGYMRKTSGYILSDQSANAETIGDEPFQMKNKFKDIAVAVCENRVLGIKNLQRDIAPDVVILDDAYQHRTVSPSCNILLMDYNRPLWKDCVFPSGRMREGFVGRRRANIVIVTKTPSILNTNERNSIAKKLRLKPSQLLYFSSIMYGKPIAVFQPNISMTKSYSNAVLITGIAKPRPLLNYLESQYEFVHHLQFADHHNYTQAEIDNIVEVFKSKKIDDTVIITTEKDSARLRKYPQLSSLPIFYIPITCAIYGGEKSFDAAIAEFMK